jgi:methylmalonyl-CoA mutase
MTEEERLLSEFPYPTYEEWRKTTEVALKGASFEKKLITRTYEGIDLQPIYRKEDGENLPHTNSYPGFAPYLRGKNAAGYYHQAWDICQELTIGTPAAFNAALRSDMERGQTAVNIVLDTPTRAGIDADKAQPNDIGRDGLSLSTLDDLATALDGIDLEQFPIVIQAGENGIPIAAMLMALVQKQGKSPANLRGCIGVDPLGTLAHTGTIAYALPHMATILFSLATWARTNAPGLRTVLVQGHPYHDGGASATQELGFALATGVEYLRLLQQHGMTIDDAALSIQFSLSLGSNFFMEVAKMRAARLLWAKVVQAFGGSASAQALTLHARTSAWNKTTYDPYVNMLRTTTEAFSGVVGGCNSLHVSPFDEPMRVPDFFSRRIARNTQIILQQESHLDRVIDPAGGSWYGEVLTDEVGKNAWAIFQAVEKLGGMTAALQAGYPQEQIATIAKKRMSNIDQRRDIFVGVNMYANSSEKPLEIPMVSEEEVQARYQERTQQIANYRAASGIPQPLANAHPNEVDVMDVAIAAMGNGATLGDTAIILCFMDGNRPTVPPVQIHRGAERYEELRNQARAYTQRTGTPPQVFLANMGPIPQHKPRADFSTGFLQVGGFEVLTNNGFATPQEAAQAALDSGAPIVVICSTDDTYPELVPPLAQMIKATDPAKIILLAGYPQDQIEAHQQSGVDDFIHLRANCYELLAQLQNKIGVTL